MARYLEAEMPELTITATSTKDRKEQLQLFWKNGISIYRYMRTPHSEIYGIFISDQVEKGPVGRVDIHYSLYGLVSGLVVMEQDFSETETEELIA